jgi:hypothetical protein
MSSRPRDTRERVFDSVRLLDERRFTPPRAVEVEHDGRWWAGWQSAWRLCDDARGWMADVTWTEQHEWGPGSYLTMVPPERLRMP